MGCRPGTVTRRCTLRRGHGGTPRRRRPAGGGRLGRLQHPLRVPPAVVQPQPLARIGADLPGQRLREPARDVQRRGRLVEAGRRLDRRLDDQPVGRLARPVQQVDRQRDRVLPHREVPRHHVMARGRAEEVEDLALAARVLVDEHDHRLAGAQRASQFQRGAVLGDAAARVASAMSDRERFEQRIVEVADHRPHRLEQSVQHEAERLPRAEVRRAQQHAAARDQRGRRCSAPSTVTSSASGVPRCWRRSRIVVSTRFRSSV